ncbi:MAG: hypothetical protein JSW27_04625, partial [Phycisphaerales bacterium]
LDAGTVRQAVDRALAVYDVECEGDQVPRYIHKVKDGTHVYLFANLGRQALETHVQLRGRMDLEAWDPHTGRAQPATYSHESETNQSITRLLLQLPPRKSLFFVGREALRVDTRDTNEPSADCPTVQPRRVVRLDPDYGGQWVVAGDVDGDGQVEIVSSENVNVGDVHYTSTAVAQELDGSVLWRWGDPQPGRKVWHHDVACQIHDWDADGDNEVVLCTKGALVVLDGTTGAEMQRITIAKDATDCLVFCHLSSANGPCDVLVKDRYHQIWAYNAEGNLLWTVRDPGGYRTAHQPRPLDLDGDGLDEIFAGYAMLKADGSIRWVFQSQAVDQKRGHLDCARVVCRGDSPSEFRIALTLCGANHVALIDGNGALLWEASGHHYESVDVGRVLPHAPGPQIVVDIDHQPYGNSPLCVFDEQGHLLGRITTNYSRHHALLDWNGDSLDEMIVAHTCGLYDHHGVRIATLATPGAERPNVKGTYEKSVLIGDMDGDRIADLTLVTPDRVYVYRNVKGKRADGAVRLGSERNFTLY